MTPHQTGLLVSGIFHLGLLLAVFFNVAFTMPVQSSDRQLPVSLDMFATRPGPGPEPVPEVVTRDSGAAEHVPEAVEAEPAPGENIPEESAEKSEPAPEPVAEPIPESGLGPRQSEHRVDTEVMATVPDVNTTYVRLLERQYTDALKQAIEARKFYPARARRRAHEGAVIVGFRVGREGDINNIRVVRSSSVRILDRAAINAVHSVGRFQPIPADIEREWWEFEIALTYQLL